MKLLDTPPPTYDFGYRQLPQSGNEINGLGETERRRARPVFHDATGCTLAWSKLDNFFGYICRWGIVKYILANVWQLRRRNGPVAPVKVDVQDPQAMASQIKAKAMERRRFDYQRAGLHVIGGPGRAAQRQQQNGQHATLEADHSVRILF